MDDDITLMLAVKKGDRKAFDAILDRHEKQILNYVFRFTGSRADAEDVTQEVFLRVYRAAGNYSPEAKFTTWLYRIAYNTSIDYLRKKKRDAGMSAAESFDDIKETEDGKKVKEAADTSAEESSSIMESRERDRVVRKAMLSLPENQRNAMIFRIYEERNYSEIAELMGVSVSSVESLLFRARQSLKIFLSGI